jgi:GNAT superfamily N-acetyltransferase
MALMYITIDLTTISTGIDSMISIRDPQPNDESAWRELWHGYNAFYQTELPEQVTAATWRRILDPTSALFCRLAFVDEHVVGFANCVLHEGTWVTTPICYLEDLFVAPGSRGAGIGRTLLADLVDLAQASGWSRLYWHTSATNPARKLYDEFIPAGDTVHYRMGFEE